MASGELFIDLEYKRYAEIPVTAARPDSRAPMELAERQYREKALARVKIRASWDPFARDLLIALGLADE